MLKRFGTHLRGNVVGYVALFVMLGGSAYALPGKGVIDKNDLRKGVVKTKNLKANAATGAKVNESTLNFTCTNSRAQFNSLCFETAFRSADSWESAFGDCEDEGGQLPSLAELAAADDTIGLTAGSPDLWAGDIWDDGASERASAYDVSAGIPLRQDQNELHQYVCAFPLFK